MTDRHRSDAERVIPNLPRPSIIILRDYDHPARKAYIKALAVTARKQGHIIIVAGNPALAASLKADGAHLPEHMLPKLAGFRRRWPHLIYSVAAHGLPSLLLAEKQIADLALLSPIFPTGSHKGSRPLGLLNARRLINNDFNLPIYALGGISKSDLARLSASNFSGFAGISLFSTTNMLLSGNNTLQKTGFYRSCGA
jgi:thiamine-phosphate pyrophosphorylase